MTEKIQTMILLEGVTLKGNVIENVHVCGLVSANGYSYLTEALKSAAPLYEKADIFANHKDQRLVEDKIGWLEGISFKDGSGLWAAKMVLNEAHPMFPQIAWWVEHNPSKIGLSHSVGGTLNKSTKMVEKITAVESVDLVAKPATTKGLQEAIREGILADRMKERNEKIRLDMLVSTAYDIATSTLWTSALSESEKIAKLIQISEELVQELKPKTTKESNNMEWDKIKLEDLAKNCPALVEQIRKDARVEGAADEKRVLEALAKVPEKARTALFESQVRAAKDQAATDALVEDRIAVSKPVEVESKSAAKPEIKEQKKDDVVEVDETKIAEETRKRLGLV